VGARLENGCWRELLHRRRCNRGRRRQWEYRARRRRQFPMGQTGCCCVSSVDGRNACHGFVHVTSCQATSWRHGDTAQGGQHRCLQCGVAPLHLVRRWAPSEIVQPPPSVLRHRRGRPATQWRGDCESLFAGRRHHATWRGRCHRARGVHRTPPGRSCPRGRWWVWRNGWGIGAKCRQWGIVMSRV